ncbi:E3 ubiquitin-protein ligase UBR2-like isoform X2 [Watersipora subatra]|uniref:E3 ubiquitin-protein ligase UBR2-like isoform X2 n=1 Tax=Watersipora subatra TaxID=2589382 RepID=UPI00355B5C80
MEEMPVYFGDVQISQDYSNLKQTLYAKWKDAVPGAYNQELTAQQREQQQKKLLTALDKFITQSDDPSSILNNLKAADDPPLYCGRALRNGEPTYSCRDCALDPTCVLCMQCFHLSGHKTHKYRINTSGGSGYCDCGDVDAWKTAPACSQHDKANLATKQDPEARLPEDIKRRAEVLIDVVLQHCYTVLVRQEYNRPLSELDNSSASKTSSNCFCVMLLNDEIHTYDQVIERLEKAVHCTRKEGVEYATTVDREGRTPVYRGPRSNCQKISSAIQEKFSSSDKKILEALIMHETVVAHQEFALSLLRWLEHLLEYSDGVRRVFCRVAMSPRGNTQSLVEDILLSDTLFWKATRQQFHQLFMTGVFKDVENKTLFAILFTKHYGAIYEKFVRDDHYRIASATVVTVQIYTVTTIVKVLIEKHHLIEVILRTILKESEKWKNERGILSFQRRRIAKDYDIFKKVQFALNDLKYALSSALPGLQWSTDMKKSFLAGFSTFLELFSQIQGMDGMKRFTTQHIEIEPEWETAFNIQLKSHDCIALLLRWCSSNTEILFDVYSTVLQHLVKLRDVSTCQITVAQHTVDCCMFEVGGTESYTSIHLPLHRMLAGLNNYLPEGVNFLSPQFAPLNKRMDLADLLEYPLRVLVLLAQVQADMWKRNGYSILNQIYYYQFVKCRQEMYDRDIQLLQAIAALMDPNSFIIHLLHKFNIASVFQQEEPLFSSLSVKLMTTLIDEFLHLLIIILGERYVEGVGEVTRDEIIQREIIHLLAINRMSHSDLDKNLPEDPNLETNLESNVQKVAEFQRTAASKGMYSLTDECRSQFNSCFYHYNKSDQSKAEDYQRLHRKNSGLDQALPIPSPPRWCSRYAAISKLYTCDVMLYLIHTLLGNMVAKRSKLKSESHTERVLHLITLALHNDKQACLAGDKSLAFVKAAQSYYGASDYHSARLNERFSIHDLLNKCVSSPHVTHEPIKDLLQYVLKYFVSVAEVEFEAAAQSSKTASPADDLFQQQAARDRQRRLNKAAKSRSKLLDKMAKMQRKFLLDSKDLFEECSNEAESQLKAASSLMDISSLDDTADPVALGLHQTPSHSHVDNFVCILCQGASTINDDSTIVYAALIQRSSVLSRKDTQAPEGTSVTMLFTPADLRSGVFTSTCGHPMHASCWKRYHENAVAKEQARAQRAFLGWRIPLFDIEKGEFYCPLCESIANAVLPVLPSVQKFQPSLPVSASVSEVTLTDWLKVLTQLSNAGVASAAVEEHCPFPDLARQAADTVFSQLMGLYDYIAALNETVLSEEMSGMVTKYLLSTYSVFKGVKVSPLEALEEKDLGPVIWNTTAYTIQVTEHLLRSDGKPLFGHLTQREEMCIMLLVRFASICRKVLPQSVVGLHCKTLLQGLLLPHPTQPNQFREILDIMSNNCILDIDVWHYLVSLVFALPSLFASRTHLIPTGSVNEQYLLHVLLSLHMTQIMLGSIPSESKSPVVNQPSSSATATQPEEDTNMDTEEDNSCKLIQVYMRIHASIGIVKPQSAPSARQLQTHIINASLPFLRCAALLFANLTDVPAPPALHALSDPPEEYAIISRYLAIPASPSELFIDEVVEILVNKCSDMRVQQRFSQGRWPLMVVEYPLKVNTLVKLPSDFSELINSASLFMCPNSMGSDESRTPTLCLICGEMLCSQSYCCQVEMPGFRSGSKDNSIGAASHHAIKCGNGSCMFLRVRQCQVVLLSGHNKGCFLPAPYVDDYGESDVQLKRGNPLHLCSTAYRDLHRLWLSHGIQQRVARSVIASSGHLLAEWFHL